MPDTPQTLDSLRRRIDEIDDAIHDLIMQRAALVHDIAAAKNGDPLAMRPGREAAILRRLAARHAGGFPLPELTRIWRELIAGCTRMQAPFAVAVHAPESRGELWDLAHDHYGSHTPMTAVAGPIQAIRAVHDGSAAVAVVPWPVESDADPWWQVLLSDDPRTPRVVGSLPFVVTERHRDEPLALAVAQIDPEPTGDDHALIAVEVTGDISRSRLKQTFEAAGLPPVAFWTRPARTPEDSAIHLVDVADFVAAGDGRLATLAGPLEELAPRIRLIGGFATPITIGRRS
ncbi:chorismate mutase [Inquilinus limosus]|uniref:chorismate mutase n=1 Tax=Inquilinus limosus TaxID=171674 RepID=UPI00047AC867|nr:chorismate mutase [Inquilinus limosus]